MEHQKINIFEIPLIKLILKDLDTSHWISLLYQLKKENPGGVSKSNGGGYQSEDDLHLNQLFFPLIEIINSSINKIFKDPNLKIMGMWGNISSFSNFNWPHSHSSDKLTQMISGVLYLQVPKNSGDIVFCSPYDVNIQVFKHTPIEKEIILFPANTQHLVYPNESNEDRLSIAFNISL